MINDKLLIRNFGELDSKKRRLIILYLEKKGANLDFSYKENPKSSFFRRLIK